jgi:hypothetical protein
MTFVQANPTNPTMKERERLRRNVCTAIEDAYVENLITADEAVEQLIFLGSVEPAAAKMLIGLHEAERYEARCKAAKQGGA